MQLGLVRNHEEMKKSLEQDIMRHKAEEERLRRRNYELEKQREKAAMNASSWHSKHEEVAALIHRHRPFAVRLKCVACVCR